MKTAIILLSGALLLIGCASGQSRRAARRAQPVASRPAPSTGVTTNYVTSAASGSSYATAQPFPGGG